MTCYAAEDGAQQTSFGSDLATSKAKTQAGYAIVSLLNTQYKKTADMRG
jgi:hypothetical protein